MMLPQQHVCNGLARPSVCADESMLAWDGRETDNEILCFRCRGIK